MSIGYDNKHDVLRERSRLHRRAAPALERIRPVRWKHDRSVSCTHLIFFAIFFIST